MANLASTDGQLIRSLTVVCPPGVLLVDAQNRIDSLRYRCNQISVKSIVKIHISCSRH